MDSNNEKEKQLISETNSLKEDIKQLIENAEKQKIHIGVIEAECLEINKKIYVKDDALNKAVKKLEKFKVEDKCKLEAKDNIIKTLNENIKKEKLKSQTHTNTHKKEIIAKESTIQTLEAKLIKLIETTKSKPQQMDQEWK